MSEIMETCYLCDAPLKEGKFICNHSPEQKEAGNILMDIEFCDHFCCEKPPNLCRATKLAELLKTRRPNESAR